MERGGMGGLGGIWGGFPPYSSIPATLFHSRESGNLAGRHRPPRIATGDIVLPLRGISRESGKRFPRQREWNEGGMGGMGGMGEKKPPGKGAFGGYGGLDVHWDA